MLILFFIILNSLGLEFNGVAVHVTNGVKEKREKPETGLSVRFLVVSPVFAASFVTQSHFYLIALREGFKNPSHGYRP